MRISVLARIFLTCALMVGAGIARGVQKNLTMPAVNSCLYKKEGNLPQGQKPLRIIYMTFSLIRDSAVFSVPCRESACAAAAFSAV